MGKRTAPDLDGPATVSLDIDVRELKRNPEGYRLEQVEGPGAPRMIILEEDAYTLGRSAQCDLTFASNELSRSHARLTRTEAGYAVKDLDSLNGLFLNGIRVHGAQLCEGDAVQIGNIVLIYSEG